MRSIYTNTLLWECFESGYTIHIHDGERAVIAQDYKAALNILDNAPPKVTIKLIGHTAPEPVGSIELDLNFDVQVENFTKNAVTDDIFAKVVARQNITIERGAVIYG